jgi:CBS domain-containing protein
MPRTTLVRQVMTTDVVSFRPEQSIADATEQLLAREIDGGPVVDADGRVVGILTQGDLMVQEKRLHYPTVISLFGAYLELPSSHRNFEEELRKAVGATVGEVMHADPITCSPDATLESVATLMHEENVSRIPVVDDGDRLVGIIARGDILKAVMGLRREA